MKNTNRVHRNGARKPTTKQAENAEPGIQDGTYSGNCPISLTVFDHDRDAALAGCDLTAKEWADLVALAKSCETSVGALLKKTIAKAAEVMAEMVTPPAWELESAMNQNNALLQLFMERIETARVNDGTNFQIETEHGGSLICGLQELMWTTQKRLAKAVEK